MTTPPAPPRPWEGCAARSLELGEQLAGTGATATGWIGIEHHGGWGSDAPSAAELGGLAAALVAEGVRVQLLRRPGRPEGELDGGTTTVLLGHAAVTPADRWLRRLELEDPAVLPDLVASDSTTRTEPPSVGEPVDGDVWLVCTHGRRDACCAVHGRPVAAALADAGADVWETTHTGGHRFAATAVLLPDGLALGRLDAAGPGTLAGRLADGELPPALLRGRCAVPRPVQAAEALARTELGVTERDGLLPSRWVADGDRTRVVLDRSNGASWTATVRTEQATVPRAVSDGAEPTTPDEHVLVGLAEGDAPAGPGD